MYQKIKKIQWISISKTTNLRIAYKSVVTQFLTHFFDNIFEESKKSEKQ